MCKDERLAQAHENAAKSQDAPEKIKKLQEVVEKKGIDREMLKSKYEQAVTDISAYNPLYQQEMKQVFEKSQAPFSTLFPFLSTFVKKSPPDLGEGLLIELINSHEHALLQG